MEEILSNEEIDSLLELFESEGMPEDLAVAEEFGGGEHGGGRTGAAQPLDLLKPNRFNRGQLAAIASIEEVVAHKIGGLLAERLRLDVACDCVAVEQLRFATWLESLDNPIGVFVLGLPPTDYPAIMAVSVELLYGAVDRVLGGTGEVAVAPHELSDTEFSVADAVVLPILEQIGSGIREFLDTEPRIDARSTNAASAQVLPMQEVVLSVHFQLAGQPLLGDIQFALPFVAVEPHLADLQKSRFLVAGQPGGRYRDVLAKAVEDVSMSIAAEFPRSHLTLKDLLALRVGDIVPLAAKPGDALELRVQGRDKFLATAGTRGNRFAAKIRETVASR